MKIDIYTLTTRDTFLVLPAGTQPPAHIDMTGAKLFKQLDLKRGDKRIAIDAESVLDDLERQGWAIVGATVLVG